MKKETIQYFCDCCDEQISPENPRVLVYDFEITLEIIHNFWGKENEETLHFCRDCVPGHVYNKGERATVVYNQSDGRIVSIEVTAPTTTGLRSKRKYFEQETEAFIRVIEDIYE